MSLQDAIDDMTNALEPLTTEIPGLQISGYFNPNPTPPSIDIYPADPFQEGAGFQVYSKKIAWTIRARVSTADPESASSTLLRLLDVHDPASVEGALADVATVGRDGTVSGFVRFADDPSGDLLAAQWRVEMFT